MHHETNTALVINFLKFMKLQWAVVAMSVGMSQCTLVSTSGYQTDGATLYFVVIETNNALFCC